MMCFLATASASEGVPEELFVASLALFVIAAIIVILGIVIRIMKCFPAAAERKLAVLAMLIGLVPLAFALQIYRIDFVPLYQDGTRASEPILKAMAVPALPVLGGLFLLLFSRKK